MAEQLLTDDAPAKSRSGGKTVYDDELKVMAVIHEAMEEIDEPARTRVATWICSRWKESSNG